MFNTKSILAAVLLLAGGASVSLLTQQGVSQTSPPPFALNNHLKEVTIQLQPGETSAAIQLPVLDRTIRISISFTGAQVGEFALGEVSGFHYSPNAQTFFNNDGGTFGLTTEWDFFSLKMTGNGSGAIQFQNNFSSAGTLHVNMWY